jgi:hypothetical protein
MRDSCLTLLDSLFVPIVYRWAYGPIYLKLVTLSFDQKDYVYKIILSYLPNKSYFVDLLLQTLKLLFLQKEYLVSKIKIIKNYK